MYFTVLLNIPRQCADTTEDLDIQMNKAETLQKLTGLVASIGVGTGRCSSMIAEKLDVTKEYHGRVWLDRSLLDYGVMLGLLSCWEAL